MLPQVKPRIAIVDDDASVCRALKRLIRSLDMEAEAFTSSEAYLASRTCSFRADCLILDLQMPGMSGLELQSRLAGTSLPIIFISAHVEAAEQALAAADAFLPKPFTDESLIQTLDTALSRDVFATPTQERTIPKPLP